MSLHHIASDNEASMGDGLTIKWSREEALSDITQVEIISSSSDSSSMGQTFDYVKRWDQNLSIDKVPQRILQRYAENVAHLINALFSTRQIPAAQSI